MPFRFWFVLFWRLIPLFALAELGCLINAIRYANVNVRKRIVLVKTFPFAALAATLHDIYIHSYTHTHIHSGSKIHTYGHT